MTQEQYADLMLRLAELIVRVTSVYEAGKEHAAKAPDGGGK